MVFKFGEISIFNDIRLHSLLLPLPMNAAEMKWASHKNKTILTKLWAVVHSFRDVFFFYFSSSFRLFSTFFLLFVHFSALKSNQPNNQKFTAILKVETLIKIHCIESRHQCVVKRGILERSQLKENHRFQFREFVSICVTKTISNLLLYFNICAEMMMKM